MSGGHFKLGLFVTVAVVLLVAFLLALGVLDRFKPKVAAETYFVESIQNLERGAPVRFRGVRIGTVDWIGFASTHYEEAATADKPGTFRSYIMVRMSLFGQVLAAAHVDDASLQVATEISVGLRARLATSGLGGPTFVELDYIDPRVFPAPTIDWTPEGIYIPSAPSTVVSIIDSLVKILRKVDELSVIDELAAVGKDLQRALEKVEGSDLLATTEGAMEELRAASADVRSLVDDPRLDEVIDEANATMKGAQDLVASAKDLLESDRSKLETLVADMTQMAGTLDKAGTSLDTLATAVNDSDLIPQMQTLAGELGPAGRDLSDLAKRLDHLVRGNEQQIADAIRSLRDAALELEAMLEELKANPSRILADPPPKGPPGGGP